MFPRKLFLVILVLSIASTYGCGGKDGKKKLSTSEKYEQAMQLTDPEAKAKKLADVGEEQASAGDIKAAEKSFDGAIKAAGQIETVDGKVSAYTIIAAEAIKGEMNTTARKAVEKAGDAVSRMEDKQAQTLQYAKLAVSYHKLGEERKPGIYLTKAKNQIESLETDSAQINCLCAVGYAFHQIDDAAGADELLGQAVAKSNALADARAKCDGLAAVASKRISMDQEGKATAILNDALAVARSIDDGQDETLISKVYALAAIGKQFKRAGKKDRATEIFEEASELAKKIKDTDARMDANGTISSSKK
jgi:hypothetical protein